MKNNNPCPKCGGTDILHVTTNNNQYGNTIMTGMTAFSGVVLVQRYVCCDCGYSEEWIAAEDIAKLKKKFG